MKLLDVHLSTGAQKVPIGVPGRQDAHLEI